MSDDAVAANAQADLTIDANKLRRPWWRLLLDAIFGYDFFISYRQSDGAIYATKLARQLRAEGFEVFQDSSEIVGGDHWTVLAAWALRRTGELILVGSPEVFKSTAVIAEVTAFHGTGRRIVPIEFDGSLTGLSTDSPLARYVTSDLIGFRECACALLEGPSDKAVDFLRKSFALVRQDKKRMRTFAAVGFAFGILAMGAAWLAYATVQASEAKLLAQSRVLAGRAEELAAAGDGTSAALVAMEGLIDGRTGRARPFSAEALRALYSGFHSRREIAILANDEPLNVIATSANGAMFAVGSVGGGVQVFTSTGSLICRFKHGGKVTSLAFGPDGKRILVSSEGAGAQQWNLEDVTNREAKTVGAPMVHDGQVLQAAYSPDGNRIVTAGTDRLARLWKADGSSPVEMKGHADTVRSASFSPDGQYVVTASNDKTVWVWKAADGSGVKHFTGHSREVRSASFDSSSQRIVSASDDRTAQIWELSSDRRHPPLEHKDHVFGASFSPDGSRILTYSEDATARLWDVSGEKVQPIGRPMAHSGWVMSAVFNGKSGSGGEIATASKDGKTRLWDATTGDLKAILDGHQSWETDLLAAFVNGGDHIVTASEDGTARLWRTVAGAEVTILRSCSGEPSAGKLQDAQVVSAAYSDDGSLIATGDTSGRAMIWNSKSGCLERTVNVGSTVWSVAFSPDGKMLATASRLGSVKLWDLPGGEPRPMTFGFDGKMAIRSVSFSRDGRRIVFGGHAGLVQVSDLASGKPVGESFRHKDWVQSANFGPDGRQILTASKDGIIRIWSLANPDHAKELKHSKARVFSASFDRSGGRILSSSEDGSVAIWENGPEGFKVRLLAKQNKPVWTAAFSPDEKQVLTASFDNTARLYDALTGEPLAVLNGHTSEVRSAIFSRDGEEMVTASNDGTARIWPLPSMGELIRRVAGSVPRCLSIKDRKELSLDADPPVWCRTGFGLEKEKDHSKWKPKWPYADAAEAR